ncbi:MAG: hypothetical protein ACI4WW_07055 [Candidatus Coprovivens sp.]
MDKKITIFNDTKKKKTNIFYILVPVITIIIIGIIIYIYTFVYNSDQNKTMRSLKQEGYKCGKVVCIKDEDGIKYSYDFKNQLLTVTTATYEFLMEEKTYTYNDLKKGYYCTYTTDNFTKGMKVDKTFTYSSPCDDYMDNVNEIVDIYAKFQNKK